ncbi:hypothetical protein D1AOALGA4SA_3640 [Olavius algarvensis Delta 1 endosymbiont]|nr:hypothetical protein D1AOALGA4SA_3640 [Olavius algarvensis Delta 1 endosymbiont]
MLRLSSSCGVWYESHYRSHPDCLLSGADGFRYRTPVELIAGICIIRIAVS